MKKIAYKIAYFLVPFGGLYSFLLFILCLGWVFVIVTWVIDWI